MADISATLPLTAWLVSIRVDEGKSSDEVMGLMGRHEPPEGNGIVHYT